MAKGADSASAVSLTTVAAAAAVSGPSPPASPSAAPPSTAETRGDGLQLPPASPLIRLWSDLGMDDMIKLLDSALVPAPSKTRTLHKAHGASMTSDAPRPTGAPPSAPAPSSSFKQQSSAKYRNMSSAWRPRAPFTRSRALTLPRGLLLAGMSFSSLPNLDDASTDCPEPRDSPLPGRRKSDSPPVLTPRCCPGARESRVTRFSRPCAGKAATEKSAAAAAAAAVDDP